MKATSEMTGRELHEWSQANGGDLPPDASREDYARVIAYCKEQRDEAQRQVDFAQSMVDTIRSGRAAAYKGN